jgi:hypothetical protein
MIPKSQPPYSADSMTSRTPVHPNNNRRWLALAGVGGASLAVAGTGEATVFQISQTGNFLSESTTSNFSRDLTGQPDDELPFPPWIAAASSLSVALRVFGSSAFSAKGVPSIGSYFVSDNSVFGPLGRSTYGRGTFDSSGGSTQRLVDISFTDPDINDGDPTAGLVAFTISGTPNTASARITIDALVFDDADSTGASLPGNAAVLSALGASTIPEFGTAVPEPSRIGLLALGAAGVLARRRRKATD